MHTPAPWMRRGCTIHTPDNRIIATACINVGVPADEENARLIAAAPDLLDACRKALNGLQELGDTIARDLQWKDGRQMAIPAGGFSLCRALREAIAAATGAEQQA